MKNLLYLLFFVLFSSVNCTAQQNHVINGNFEDYSQCPTGWSQISRCTGWSDFSPSSDYYNCSHSAPNRTAHSGVGYVGGSPMYGQVSQGLSERIRGGLIPLVPGVVYEVSLSVRLAQNSKFASNNIGVFFYDAGAPTGIPTPQATFTQYGPIADTGSWKRIVTTFTADSAYSKIVIGGFYNSNTFLIDTLPFGSTNYVYYIYDSVVVRVADSFLVSITDSLLCAGDTLQLPYVALKNYASNNVFTAQLSNASGSFSAPVNIGTVNSDTSGNITVIIPGNTVTGTGYKIRLVASNFADTTKATFLNLKIGGGIVKPLATNNGPACANDTLKLSASTTTTGVNYKWTGPGGYNSTLQNPAINLPVPANTGNYIVTASLYGCEAKDTTAVVVFGSNGPSGTLATTNAPICIGDTLKLFGTAAGTGVSFSWTGPNSYNSNQQNPIIPISTGASSGDYILYASNGNCISRDTVTVVIKSYPDNFTAVSDTPCVGEVLHFTANSTSGGVTYLWSGPNMFSSGNATPSIAAASSLLNGDYYVTATLNGCSLKDTVTVNVKPLPAKPVANNDITLCSGNAINLSATSATNGVSYSWSGPASYTSSAQNPVLGNSTTAMSGNYIVKVTFDGCTSTDTTLVTVNQTPAAVTLSSNSPQCAGSTLTLNSTASTTGATYQWVGPQSFSAATQNASVTSTATSSSGSYVMTVTLNGCTYKDTLEATVYPIPAAPTATANQPICVGETLQLGANTVTGATYNWSGPNGFSAAAANTVRSNITTNDAGVYQATVTVNGCTSAPGNATVVINPVPFVAIFSTPADTICNGENVTFIALPNNTGGTPQYRWLVNGQQAGTGTVYATNQLTQGDVVRCDMTEFTKCSAAYKDESNDIALEVLPWLAPSVSITASPNRTLKPDEYVTFTAVPVNGGANPKYQWKRNGSNIVGATGAIWSANTLNDNDKITVELISDYRCPQPATSGSNEITVRVATGIGDVSIAENLALYPNPNNGQFLLKGKLSVTGTVTVSIVNYIGQLIYSADVIINNGELNHEVSMPFTPAGVYLLRLNSSEGSSQPVRFTKY